MTPTQVMEAEHRLIETVVKALGGVAAALEKGQPADAAMLDTAVEFFRVYADKLHHGKEETLFFPMLVKRGVPPQGCPIGGLNHEHEKGRVLVRALADQAPAYAQGKPGAKEAMLETLQRFHSADWTPTLESQWRKAFDGAVQLMFDGYGAHIIV